MWVLGQRHHQQRTPPLADDINDVAHRAIRKRPVLGSGLVQPRFDSASQRLGGSHLVTISGKTAFFTEDGRGLIIEKLSK